MKKNCTRCGEPLPVRIWRGKEVADNCVPCTDKFVRNMLGLTEADEDTISEWCSGSRSLPPSLRGEP